MAAILSRPQYVKEYEGELSWVSSKQNWRYAHVTFIGMLWFLPFWNQML